MTGSRKFIRSYSEKKNLKLQGGPCRLSVEGILPKVRILLCSCVYVHTTLIALCERTSSWLLHPITCFGQQYRRIYHILFRFIHALSISYLNWLVG